MAFTAAQRALRRRARHDAAVDRFDANCLVIPITAVRASGGSPKEISGTGVLTPARWFSDTRGGSNMIMFEDGRQMLQARWKFYFKAAASIGLGNHILIRRTADGLGWADPVDAPNGFNYRLVVDAVFDQNDEGNAIIGRVAWGTIISDGDAIGEIDVS